MPNHQYTLYGLLFPLAALLCSLLVGCDQPDSSSPTSMATPYHKNGFSLVLPNDWEVLQDYYPEASQRLITISTSVGSSASIKVFDNSATRPNLELYLKQYLTDSIDKSQRDSVNISYGEVTRQQGRGYFVEVNLSDELQTAYYIEIVEMQYVNHLSYVTLHTPMDSKDNVLAQFNQLIDSINND